MDRIRVIGSALSVALAALAAGCNQTAVRSDADAGPSAPPTAYTCCNFHYEGDWINDGNYAQLPYNPLGAPIKVKSYGRHRAYVDIDGKPYRLGLDYGREAETVEQWVNNKMVDRANPKLKLVEYPVSVQEAIKAGKVMIGMTKEQVIMSLGYPMTSENPSTDAKTWYYWWSSFDRYDIEWDGQGRVSAVLAHPATTQRVLAPGNASTGGK